MDPDMDRMAVCPWRDALVHAVERIMAESIQRIISTRALAGQHPHTPQQLIDQLEATAQGWNLALSPFQWGGQRHARRLRSRQRQHALSGSGAWAHLTLEIGQRCCRNPYPAAKCPPIDVYVNHDNHS